MNDEWVAPKNLIATHFMAKWLNNWEYAYVIYILIHIYIKTLSHNTVDSCGGRQVFIHRFLFGEHWAGKDNFPSFNARRLHVIYINVSLQRAQMHFLLGSCFCPLFLILNGLAFIFLSLSAYVKLFRPLETFLSTYVSSLRNFYFGCFNSLIEVNIYQFISICKALNTT